MSISLPKTARARDLAVSLAMSAAVSGVALTTASLIPSGTSASFELLILLILSIATLAFSLPVVFAFLLAKPYELSKPFSAPYLLSLAAADLLLGFALLSFGYLRALVPLAAALLLAALSRALRDMRRACTFCATSWRYRLFLVAGDGFILCDQCVDVAIAEPRPPFDTTAPRLSCKACAANLPSNQYPLRSSTAVLCFSCVALAHQTIAQGRQS